MIWRSLAAAPLCLLACCSAAPEGNVSFALDDSLEEVSGLAVAGPDSVFAHNDEHAIVHEIDLAGGQIVRSFALGDPTIAGDFEGIAYSGGRVFLVTSDGLIYAARPGEHRRRVAYSVHDSGVGTRCEIEGLSHAPEDGFLLLLCKRLRAREDSPRLEIYRWPIDAERAAEEPWLSLPLKDFLTKDERARFGPSGIDWDPAAGRLYVVSGRSHLLLQLDAQGRMLATDRLDHRRHPQAEGIAILPGCRMVLADEGSPTRDARLSLYPCPPAPGASRTS